MDEKICVLDWRWEQRRKGTAAGGLLESWGLDLEELRCRMKIYS